MKRIVILVSLVVMGVAVTGCGTTAFVTRLSRLEHPQVTPAMHDIALERDATACKPVVEDRLDGYFSTDTIRQYMARMADYFAECLEAKGWVEPIKP